MTTKHEEKNKLRLALARKKEENGSDDWIKKWQNCGKAPSDDRAGEGPVTGNASNSTNVNVNNICLIKKLSYLSKASLQANSNAQSRNKLRIVQIYLNTVNILLIVSLIHL